MINSKKNKTATNFNLASWMWVSDGGECHGSTLSISTNNFPRAFCSLILISNLFGCLKIFEIVKIIFWRTFKVVIIRLIFDRIMSNYSTYITSKYRLFYSSELSFFVWTKLYLRNIIVFTSKDQLIFVKEYLNW